MLKVDGVPVCLGFPRSNGDGTEIDRFRFFDGEPDPDQVVRTEEDKAFEDSFYRFMVEHCDDQEFASNCEGLRAAAISFAQRVFQMRFDKVSDLPARWQAQAEAEAALWEKSKGQPAVPHCTVKLADGRDVTLEEAASIFCPE